MVGYCNKCGGRFEDQMLCPSCGCKLTPEANALKPMHLLTDPSDSASAGMMLLGRLAIGALLVVVFFQAFAHLSLYFEVTHLNEETNVDLATSMLTAAILLAGVTTGLANHRAELCGFILGSTSALAYIGHHVVGGYSFPSEWWIGLPMMQGFVGTTAGFTGRLLFMPAPRCRILANRRDTTIPLAKSKKKSQPLRGINILLGVILANVAFVYAEPIRQTLASVLGHGGGSYGSGRFVTWEITMIGALLAGVLAGAGGKSGLRHGLIAGLFATVGLITAAMKSGIAKIPASDFWVDQLNLENANGTVYGVLAATLLITMSIGGWLGAHLFPKHYKV